MAGGQLGANARRVVIKSRFVVLKKAGTRSAATHLRYIERDGTTRDGQRGQAYGADADAADLQAFEERGRGDRHQFRFIVSVEDASELEDLRGYTRELMARMEVDLEIRLDWVAVDHWDTDNPHTHVVLRGKVGQGRGARDLVIAPDYMAHGMRKRASELATEWLGPRTELEMRQGLMREVDQERFTRLDRALLRQMEVDVVNLTETSGKAPAKGPRQTALRARLQRLEAMALAERIDASRWRLAPGMQQTLNALGERGDILRAMHKAMKGEQRELVMDTGPTVPVIGRIAAKGLTDELHDQGYLVVDGVDGRAHYVKLPKGADLADLQGLPMGGIVEVKARGKPKAVDRTVAALSQDGVYRTADHLAHLRLARAVDPQSTVDVHVRRLEALRRAGIVGRQGDGVWCVPRDLVERARQYDQQRHNRTVVLRSHLSLDQQARILGATWLDEQLIHRGQGLAGAGFGASAREAMRKRTDFLVEQGLVQRRGGVLALKRNLLQTLRDREVALTGKALESEVGKAYRALQDGDRASGVYCRAIQLASGRFAMLDDGIGFHLVPWKPEIEPRLGQHLTATICGKGASWTFGKQQKLSVG
jgi:type IV secretory pathway VirD2 relaxase